MIYEKTKLTNQDSKLGKYSKLGDRKIRRNVFFKIYVRLDSHDHNKDSQGFLKTLF